MPEPLKNEFSKAFVSRLAAAIESVDPRFSASGFVSEVIDKDWPNRELKDRISKIAVSMNAFLPGSYTESVDTLIAASQGFNRMTAFVFPEFVGAFGLRNWNVSMKALRVFTPLCSSEFAIRPFIGKDPDKAFDQLIRWTKHKDEHVRRLASEGCRPLLPWASRIPALGDRLDDICRILEILKNDESLYVRRSVANNLNDISKIDTPRAISLAKSWKGISEDTDWVVKHAMRGLLKKGVPEVLGIFGYSDPKDLESVELTLQKAKAKMGGSLAFEARIEAKTETLGLTRVEFVVGYMKANGKLNEKVFLISDTKIQDKERTFSKRLSFKELSTRKHYLGVHTIRLAVNGERFPAQSFVLET